MAAATHFAFRRTSALTAIVLVIALLSAETQAATRELQAAGKDGGKKGGGDDSVQAAIGVGTIWSWVGPALKSALGTELYERLRDALGNKRVDRPTAKLIYTTAQEVSDADQDTIAELKSKMAGMLKYKIQAERLGKQVSSLAGQLKACKSSQYELTRCKAKLVEAQKSERACKAAHAELESQVEELQHQLEHCGDTTSDTHTSSSTSTTDTNISDDTSNDTGTSTSDTSTIDG